ncbi:MAG: lysophospholipid acyltransferase family protein [Acidocella sp.]|nr:lysophospholipid acyltransferase family protein [Acidocella sp.]
MKKFYQTDRAQAGIAWAASLYVTLVARLTRWQVEGEAQFMAASREAPLILVFWHETLPAMPVLWLRAKALGMARGASVLASRHRDGRMIGEAVARMGIEVVAGSSSRGGAAGLRGMLRALEAGRLVGITPDGPRGPRRVAAAGAVQLAALSGVRILPCGAAISSGKTLRSWDGMRWPLPFGRGALVFGAPMTVAREAWQASLPEMVAALNAVTDRAAALL